MARTAPLAAHSASSAMPMPTGITMACRPERERRRSPRSTRSRLDILRLEPPRPPAQRPGYRPLRSLEVDTAQAEPYISFRSEVLSFRADGCVVGRLWAGLMARQSVRAYREKQRMVAGARVFAPSPLKGHEPGTFGSRFPTGPERTKVRPPLPTERTLGFLFPLCSQLLRTTMSTRAGQGQSTPTAGSATPPRGLGHNPST